MKIGVLGTGMVGQAIGGKLKALGHDVKTGSRQAKDAFVTFADAATHGELVFNCTSGAGSIDALKGAGESNLSGKVLVDVANPLDFSKGMPPSLLISNTDSLGETIQRAFPHAKVVMAFNTINCELMVNPGKLKGAHDLLICGNDAGAKAEVTRIAQDWFGWKNVVDVGDLSAARGTEAYLLLWVRLWGALQSPDFNLTLVR